MQVKIFGFGIYNRGLQVRAVTLEVGDYILSPALCIGIQESFLNLMHDIATPIYFSQIHFFSFFFLTAFDALDGLEERKSLLDLIQSFLSGRLFRQMEIMCRFYRCPILLIEFVQDRSVIPLVDMARIDQ